MRTDLNIARTELEGESLYEYAARLLEKDVDVVMNDITEEILVVTCGSVDSLGHDTRTAVMGLLQTGSHAPLWHDQSVTAIVADPSEYEAIEFINRHTGDQLQAYTTEDGFEYIDDWSRRGGMVYRARDYQYDQAGGFFTRPWAQEDPEQYLEFVADSDPITSCKLLDAEQIKNAGFEPVEDHEHGMYRASRHDDPEEIRERLEEEHGPGTEVVFTVDDYHHPFETTGTVYVRTADVAV